MDKHVYSPHFEKDISGKKKRKKKPPRKFTHGFEKKKKNTRGVNGREQIPPDLSELLVRRPSRGCGTSGRPGEGWERRRRDAGETQERHRRDAGTQVRQADKAEQSLMRQ